jgi:S-DNA-T family DNA segregation ATPase FtsK/SpoIIIE
VSRRQELLGRSGLGSVAEQRAGASADERLPWLLLLLDGWEGFLATYESVDHGRTVDALFRLLREGPGAGLRAVLTGDRSLLTGRISSVIPGRLMLRMSDRMDLSLAGVVMREVPEHMPPGRALLAGGDGVLETQLALLAPDPAGPAQVAALRRFGGAARQRLGDVPRELRPFRVAELPVRVAMGDVVPAAGKVAAGRGPLWMLVGVGGDELDPLGLDLVEDGPAFVVAGPPRSGRSTTLLAVAGWYAARGVPIAVVTARRSPLRDLVGTPGVPGSFGPGDAAGLTALLEARTGPLGLLVDDAEELLDSPIESVLLDLLRSAPDHQRGIVVAGSTERMCSTYRGLTVEARKYGCGLLLSPTGPLDGDLLGVRIPRAAEVLPGRGMLAVRGRVTPVQVPLP